MRTQDAGPTETMEGIANVADAADTSGLDKGLEHTHHGDDPGHEVEDTIVFRKLETCEDSVPCSLTENRNVFSSTAITAL